MSGRWQELRATFKAKNRDLDAEFEKFLNESLSDESLGSPRRLSSTAEGVRPAQPWWDKHDETAQKTVQQEASEGSGFELSGLSISKDSLEAPTESSSPDRTKQNAANRPGLDTLNEEEEKRKFFEEEEEGISSSVDYEKKLDDLSATGTPQPLRDTDDRLQATGAELGESIFNQTGGETAGLDSKEAEYSDNFEESEKTGEQSSPEPAKQLQDEAPAPKPSMLSKVSLMESLDSTLDTKQKPAGHTKGHKDEAAGATGKESSSNTLGAARYSGKGLLSSGTTGDLRELEAALEAVHFSTSSGAPQQDSAPATRRPTEVQSPSSEDQATGHMMLEKMSGGTTRAQGFDLQPVIVNDVTADASANDALPYKESLANTVSFMEVGESAGESDAAKRGLGPGVRADCPPDGDGVLRPPAAPRMVTNYLPDGNRTEMTSRFLTDSPPDGNRTEVTSRLLANSLPDGTGASGHEMAARAGTYSPSGEGRGFSLQPLVNLVESSRTEGEGEDRSEEEDTPPPDSLRGIKSIAHARRSAGLGQTKPRETSGTKKSTSRADKRRAQESGKKGKLKTQQLQPSPSSVPTWSPTPGTRRGTPKSKKSTSQSKTAASPLNKSASKATEQLMTSVDSFASYLKQFVRPEPDQQAAPPPVRWSDDEPSRSASRGVPSDPRRLSRERALQQEVAHWQETWKDERRRNDKLIAEIAAREKETSVRDEKARLAYEQQLHDLQQEVLLLQSQLAGQRQDADVKQRVLSGASLQGVSAEELQRMEKEIREQEELLRGYQLENERLYKELKQHQAQGKASHARLFSENQKLASEVLNLKEKLHQLGPAKVSSPGSAVLAAERVADLQAQLSSLRLRETELQRQLTEEKESKLQLELRLRRKEVGTEEDTAVKASVSDMRERHAAELEKLNRRLKWYAENQQLLDRDTAALQRKDREIQELRDTLARLQAQRDQSTTEKSKRQVERSADARRIQDLERQVREMEEIIRRRYPNSLPALIYAAASAPGHAQLVKDESPKKDSASQAFLENRIRKLEAALENKEEESGRRIRAVEQQYSAVRVAHDERVRQLEAELKVASGRLQDESHGHAQLLEKKLAASQERVRELDTEVKVLQDALARDRASDAARRSPRARRRLGDEKEAREKLTALEESLRARNAETEELKQTCARLQREREQMLACADEQHSQRNARAEALGRENAALSDQAARLALELEQERVHHQASRAEAERALRQAREEAADLAERSRAQHQREVTELKAGFAVSHGTSRVAELQSRVSAQEVIIERLKGSLGQAAGEAASLATARVLQQTLQERVDELEVEIQKAKAKFSPEMKHFDALETKVAALERKHSQREQELQRIIDSNLIKARQEKDDSDAKWRQVLQLKQQQMDQFRAELDSILEVLSELRRQGVLIPFKSQDIFYSLDGF